MTTCRNPKLMPACFTPADGGDKINIVFVTVYDALGKPLATYYQDFNGEVINPDSYLGGGTVSIGTCSEVSTSPINYCSSNTVGGDVTTATNLSVSSGACAGTVFPTYNDLVNCITSNGCSMDVTVTSGESSDPVFPDLSVVDDPASGEYTSGDLTLSGSETNNCFWGTRDIDGDTYIRLRSANNCLATLVQDFNPATVEGFSQTIYDLETRETLTYRVYDANDVLVPWDDSWIVNLPPEITHLGGGVFIGTTFTNTPDVDAERSFTLSIPVPVGKVETDLRAPPSGGRNVLFSSAYDTASGALGGGGETTSVVETECSEELGDLTYTVGGVTSTIPLGESECGGGGGTSVPTVIDCEGREAVPTTDRCLESKIDAVIELLTNPPTTLADTRCYEVQDDTGAVIEEVSTLRLRIFEGTTKVNEVITIDSVTDVDGDATTFYSIDDVFDPSLVTAPNTLVEVCCCK